MTAATQSINNLKVDYIVMLIKWCSHAMYYKVKSALYDTPIININTKNLDRVLWEMAKHVISPE